MTELNILLLSMLQGITEFLPISSSGHLILFSKFTSFPDQGNSMDVALHIGSVLAIILYFYKDIALMMRDLWHNKLKPNLKIEGVHLFYLLFFATIPALVVGATLKLYGVEFLRNTRLIGWNLIIFGILLWFSDTFCLTVTKIKNLSIKNAVVIGIAQCLALFPGTSRSGATITMCRFLGMERREAAKFSMLMAIPAIICAGIVTALEIINNNNISDLLNYQNCVLYSFVFSLLSIYILMAWLKKWSFLPFVIYRLVLGTILLLDSYDIYRICF